MHSCAVSLALKPQSNWSKPTNIEFACIHPEFIAFLN